MRLLAVDDDPAILDLLPMVFRQAGLPQVTVASSAAAALELIASPDRGFDGLILDIDMPGMTGIELCRAVRKRPGYRNTPILMLSAASDDVSIEQAFAAGADDYITKPFDVKDIANRVRVAERMAARSVKAPVLSSKVQAHDATPGVHAFAQNVPLRLADTQQLVLPFALGNYLSQLSRRRLDNCSIFAARLEQIGSLYAATKPHEFARLLEHIVAAIARVIGCPQPLMSYEGDGVFLCITQGAEPPAWPEIEHAIEEVLAAGPSIFDDGRSFTLSLSVGNPIMPNASRNQRVKKTFDRARDRLHYRERSKARERPPMAGFFALPPRLGNLQPVN